MKKELDIIIRLINNKNANSRRLAEYFVRKYNEKGIKNKI